MLRLDSTAQLVVGLEGYGQFNSDAIDSSGAGLNLELIGSPGFSPGLLGCAHSLNGIPSQFARQPKDGDVFDVGGDDFTVQVWINFQSTFWRTNADREVYRRSWPRIHIDKTTE